MKVVEPKSNKQRTIEYLQNRIETYGMAQGLYDILDETTRKFGMICDISIEQNTTEVNCGGVTRHIYNPVRSNKVIITIQG